MSFLQKKIVLSSEIIIRGDDKIIFNVSKQQLYSFNDIGFEIVSYIQKNSRTREELYDFFKTNYDLSKDSIDMFLEKGLRHEIIYEL
jgi:hypothetical protein